MGVVNESGKNRSISASNLLWYVVIVCCTSEYFGRTCPSGKSACWWKRILESGLIRWSAIFIEVSIRSKWIRSRSTQSHRAKFLISMCQVRAVGFCVLPMVVHPSLSLYAMVAASWGMLRSQKDAAYEERHASDVACGHTFGFCGQKSNSWLKPCFIGDSSTG